MPEGPEVKVIVNQLDHKLDGHAIVKVEIISGRYQTHGPPDGFHALPFEPLMIDAVSSKGKFIYFTLGQGWYIFNTLGMTGTWSVDPIIVRHVHGRMRFHLDDDTVLTFIDTRNFGTLKFVNDRSTLQKKINSLGWDVLSKDDVPSDWILDKIGKKPTSNVTEVLMNQQIFAGVGNYIKAEVLYRAKISPHRTADEISRDEWHAVFKHVHDVCSESLMSMGTSIRDYKDTDGNVGQFQNFLRVYGRKYDPEGHPVIKETTLDNRTTHWVPDIQK